jgi:hypothetical protein
MMHQYDQLQIHTYMEATKLAAHGKEFSHLVRLLDPDKAMRLKLFVLGLPQDIQHKTIYGKSVSKCSSSVPAGSKKKRN